MSRSKLTDVQKFFIDGHKTTGVTKLAEQLGVSVSSVKKYLEETQPVEEESKVEKKDESHHMITKSAGGRSGIAIMTEAASMRTDSDVKSKGDIKAHVHTIK